MRVVSLLSLLLLPLAAGCEGNAPRRSSLAVSSSPSAAKTVEYAPQVKGATPGPRPAGQANPDPQPGVAIPANNAPITIDADKLETRRQQLNYHTAIFLRSEVGALSATGIQENNNFVFRPAEGLDKLRIAPAVSAFRADKGKAPQTVPEFLNLMAENSINLAELKHTEFYIYDPALAAMESSKENLDYLQQYP